MLKKSHWFILLFQMHYFLVRHHRHEPNPTYSFIYLFICTSCGGSVVKLIVFNTNKMKTLSLFPVLWKHLIVFGFFFQQHECLTQLPTFPCTHNYIKQKKYNYIKDLHTSIVAVQLKVIAGTPK